MPDFPERAYLRQFLADHFNLAELQDIAFDLSVDYEELQHSTKSEFCRELIAYFERKENLSCLLIEILKYRDDIVIKQLIAKFSSCASRKKIQIILPGDKMVNKPDLIGALAQLLGVQADDVQLIATAPGSIRVLLGLPGNVANWLLDEKFASFLAQYGFQVLNASKFENLKVEEQIAWRQNALKHWASGSYQPFGLVSQKPDLGFAYPLPAYGASPQPSIQPAENVVLPPPQLPQPLPPTKTKKPIIFVLGGLMAGLFLMFVLGLVVIQTLINPIEINPTAGVATFTLAIPTTSPATLLPTNTAFVPATATILFNPTVTPIPTPTPSPTATARAASAIFVNPTNDSLLRNETLVQFRVLGPVDHITVSAQLPGDIAHHVLPQTVNLGVLNQNSNWQFRWNTTVIPPQSGISLNAFACNSNDSSCIEVIPVTGLKIAPPAATFANPLSNSVGGFNGTLVLTAKVSGIANHINYSIQAHTPKFSSRSQPIPVRGTLNATGNWTKTISLQENTYDISGTVCWSSDDSICYDMPPVTQVFVSSTSPPG